jgi:hypothetical protein
MFSFSSSASITRFGARATAVTISAIALATSAAAMVPEKGVKLSIAQMQHVRLLIPAKPPPVSGYKGPKGPVCRRVCVGSGGGGNPKRPSPCQWQTVCN